MKQLVKLVDCLLSQYSESEKEISLKLAVVQPYYIKCLDTERITTQYGSIEVVWKVRL